MGRNNVEREIKYKIPKTVLNKGTGYLSGYTHSLNPYTGCVYSCSYCYVQRMPVALFRGKEWGTWIDVKQEAAQLLTKELAHAKSKGRVTIFMSSSTDPYQPIEHREKITRSLLEVMIENPPDFLLVQTRSPLVSRDIDLLKKLKDKVRVSLTIETDEDRIRKYFTPYAPPIQARLNTLKKLADAKIPTQVAVSPILPSSADFPKKLRHYVNRICIDDYFMGDGSGGKRSHQLGMKDKYVDLGFEEWYQPETLQKVYSRFLQVFKENQVYISQKGFEP